MKRMTDETDYKDFFIECFSSKKPRAVEDMKCRTTPVDEECGTPKINEETKQVMNEFVFERVDTEKYRMCDVAKMRVFPRDDIPPMFLLLVEPLEHSTPHQYEVPFLS